MGTDQKVLETAAKKFSTVLVLRGTKQAALSNWSKGSKFKHETKYIPEGCNLGIITGPASNLMVVDVDKPEIFLPMAKAKGFDWKNHLVVKTPKGFHIYFKYNADIAKYFNSARVNLAMGLTGCEMLIRDSYVLAPGSEVIQADGTVKSYSILYSGGMKEQPPIWILEPMIQEHLKREHEIRNSIKTSEAKSPEDCWNICGMASKLQQEGKRNEWVYWFAKVLFDRGNGLECVNDVASMIDEVTDPSFTFREAHTTLSKRIERLTKVTEKSNRE